MDPHGQGADSDLLARLRQRHPGAFDQLYQRHRAAIWTLLLRLSGRPDFAQDLFQETWLAAARNAHGLREDTHLLAWLCTIARNKYKNALRGFAVDRGRQAAFEALHAGGTISPDTEANDRRRARRVLDAMGRLPEAHREVLTLAAIDGMGAPEIAKVLDVREDAVRKRLSRARAELLAMVDTKEGDR